MQDYLDKIEKEFIQLETQLQDTQLIKNKKLYNQICSDFSKIKTTVELYRKYKTLQEELKSCEKMSKEDPSLQSLIQEENQKIKKQIQEIEEELKECIKFKDPLDSKNVILEMRAGAGGDEAGLFCKELFQAYERYSSLENWKLEILSCSLLETGGFREVISSISGSNVYGKMKFESGVHRVQRVPQTESGGRIHTSTITVAILPEAQKTQLHIKPEDIRTDSYRASGAGGQHVNTTDSAIRVVHLPTKITVSCQDEKSQHANKEKALKILYAKILSLQEEQKRKKASETRLKQIGSGDRSEKIRTYNFPQSRVTDHRANFTSHALDRIMKGELDILIQPLIEKNRDLL